MTPVLHSDLFRASGGYVDDGDHDWHDDRFVIDGERKGTGLDMEHERPVAMESAGEFPDELLVPEDELKDAFEVQRANHATLFDLRERVNGKLDSLDQGQFPLCWDFDAIKVLLYGRAIAGEPFVDVSPWYPAGIIQHWHADGGFIELSMDFLSKHGTPKLSLCPSFDRKYATPEAVADASNHTAPGYWLGSQSDKDKRTHQMLSAIARGYCGGTDFNWMGHSMAYCYVPTFKSLNDFELDTDNSWGMKAGVKGLYRLTGSKARPDSLAILHQVKASAA